MRDTRAVLPDPWSVPWLSVAEAGALLHLSRATAYRAARSGDLPTIVVHGHLRVRVSDLYRLRRLPLPAAPADDSAPLIWSS